MAANWDINELFYRFKEARLQRLRSIPINRKTLTLPSTEESQHLQEKLPCAEFDERDLRKLAIRNSAANIAAKRRNLYDLFYSDV